MIQGVEDYMLLRNGLPPVWAELNDSIESPLINIKGREYQLNFVLGGDYKVNKLVLGRIRKFNIRVIFNKYQQIFKSS